jgi:hypothetical protein
MSGYGCIRHSRIVQPFVLFLFILPIEMIARRPLRYKALPYKCKQINSFIKYRNPKQKKNGIAITNQTIFA